LAANAVAMDDALMASIIICGLLSFIPPPPRTVAPPKPVEEGEAELLFPAFVSGVLGGGNTPPAEDAHVAPSRPPCLANDVLFRVDVLL
jgi:hypothetical protein